MTRIARPALIMALVGIALVPGQVAAAPAQPMYTLTSLGTLGGSFSGASGINS